MDAANGISGDAGEAGESPSTVSKPIRTTMKRKRRTRTLSLEAEIKLKAKQIIQEREAEAYKAAALMICSRKLDEVSSLLRSIGATSTGIAMAQSGISGAPAARPISPVIQPNPVEHPCCQCGREGVRRTKPNRFNRTGSWYCAAHVRMAAMTDGEDRMDAALLGGTAEPPIVKQPVVAPAPPVQMVQPSAPPQEPAGEASLDAAMASLGFN